MENFDADFWDAHYQPGKKNGWDIGYAAPALMEYCKQLPDKNIDILIPGAGLAWEAEELFSIGFRNTYILEFASQPVKHFLARCPNFPKRNIIQDDFFLIDGQYDLILEQTFFTSLPRSERKKYAEKMHQLLKPAGKLVGLVFTHDFDGDHPPFGAREQEYRELFKPYFNIKTFDIAYNSIKPRKGREFFMILERRL